jgi:uncharacterized protein
MVTYLRSYPAINELIIKLSSRCNINCSYCYWFKDPLVMSSPKMLLCEVQEALVTKLHSHIIEFNLKKFNITFHGGEPTLFPTGRFNQLCHSIKNISQKTGCFIQLSMQSNGLLIDDIWIELLLKYKVNLGISLDGDQLLHDKNRIDFKGKGTYLKTVNAIKKIQASGIHVYILSVAAPQTNAIEFIQHMVHQLGIKQFDVLIPHLHHDDDDLESIERYFNDLFIVYLNELIELDVEIRILDSFMNKIIASNQEKQSELAYISTVTLLTDGFLETTDDLRGADDLTPSIINIKTSNLQSVCDDPLWQEIYHSSLVLHEKCHACQFKSTCAGGPMATRWSKQNRFNNPSVYCDDLFSILTNATNQLTPLITNAASSLKYLQAEVSTH